MKARAVRSVKTAPSLEKSLDRFVQEIFRYVKYPSKTTVQVTFLSNTVLRRLKKEHLGKDVPFVDVLAFPEPKNFPHPEVPGRSLGEIYLNESFRKNPEELARMLIHGLVHLMGYRHETKRDTIMMERLENRLRERVRIRGRSIGFRT